MNGWWKDVLEEVDLVLLHRQSLMVDERKAESVASGVDDDVNVILKRTILKLYSSSRQFPYVWFDDDTTRGDSIGQFIVDHDMLSIEAMLWFQAVQLVVEALVQSRLCHIVDQTTRETGLKVENEVTIEEVINGKAIVTHSVSHPRTTTRTQVYLGTVNQSVSQSINQSTNQSVSQSISQSA